MSIHYALNFDKCLITNKIDKQMMIQNLLPFVRLSPLSPRKKEKEQKREGTVQKLTDCYSSNKIQFLDWKFEINKEKNCNIEKNKSVSTL